MARPEPSICSQKCGNGRVGARESISRSSFSGDGACARTARSAAPTQTTRNGEANACPTSECEACLKFNDAPSQSRRCPAEEDTVIRLRSGVVKIEWRQV